MISESLLDNCLDKVISKKNIYSTVMRVENGDGSFSWTGARGDMKPDSKFYIASVTKLYVTAVIMSLIEEQKLCLDDKIGKYLPRHYTEKLHVLKGRDYSDEITVRHLLSNTSGLPDYFTGTAFTSLLQGNDDDWGFDKTINTAKEMTPKFAPGKKAAYSDTNYRLLGKIIEVAADNDTRACLHQVQNKLK